MLRVDYVKQLAKVTGENTELFCFSSHSQVTDTEIQEDPGKLLACSLLLLFYPEFYHVTTESRGAQTDPLAQNYCLSQDAVFQWMVPNVVGEQLMLLWSLCTFSIDKDFRLYI